MKNKKMVAAAAAATILLLALGGGTIAAKTVFAAEKVVMTEENSSTVLHNNLDTEILKVYKEEFYHDTGCTMILPAGYVISDSVQGMYISDRSPIDSSNIYYTVSESTDSKMLRETLSGADYKERTEQRFKEAYGADAEIKKFDFKETKIDGCPAYQIKLSCVLQDMTIEQLIYIVAADKTYTITYSQSADDERMEEFEVSAKSIHVIFEENPEEKEK